MNKFYVSVQTIEDPRQVYVDSSRTNVLVNALIPPAKDKAPTPVTLHIYAPVDQARVMQTVKANCHLFIAGGKLRHNLETREYSIHGGSISLVSPETFPIINEVVLSGRCIKDIDQADARAYKRTDSGYVICNQTLSVNTGKNKADLFNFFAINKADDRFNKADYLSTFTRNGTGLTISGRVVTDAWTDKATGQAKNKTQIQMYDMTLAPKPKAGTIEPRTELPANTPVQSLWGGQTQGDVPDVGSETLVPESPHQAAIASPIQTSEGQVLASQQEPPAPVVAGPINSSNDAWDDNDAPF